MEQHDERIGLAWLGRSRTGSLSFDDRWAAFRRRCRRTFSALNNLSFAMTPKRFCEITGRLMRCPTAPYHEEIVRAEVERICAEQHLDFQRDEFGNLWLRHKMVTGRPLVLAAHMDHPGFEVVRSLPKNRWLLRFNG